MKIALLTGHVIRTLPDSMTDKRAILEALGGLLPRGEERTHVRVLLQHLTEYEQAVADAQAELPLTFTPGPR